MNNDLTQGIQEGDKELILAFLKRELDDYPDNSFVTRTKAQAIDHQYKQLTSNLAKLGAANWIQINSLGNIGAVVRSLKLTPRLFDSRGDNIECNLPPSSPFHGVWCGFVS